MPTTTDLFPDIIGQEKAKKKLAFYHAGFNSTRIVPNLMFTAPKGCGKTTLAKALAKNLVLPYESKAKKFLELNCSSVKSVQHFFDGVVMPHVDGKDVTVLFDEASELPKDLTMALLTVTNPNKDKRTSFTSPEGYTVHFDFRRVTFLFATSEPHKVFHALMDRLERIELEDYSHDDLGKIVEMNIGEDIDFEDGVLNEVAPVLRGNARAAQKIADNFLSHLKGRNRFTKDDWNDYKNTFDVLPFGLSEGELKIMRILRDCKECSLTNLAAKTGLTVEAIRRDAEMYLQKMNLIEIRQRGRALTPAGVSYLRKVDGERK